MDRICRLALKIKSENQTLTDIWNESSHSINILLYHTFLDGNENMNSLSNRPGLLRAGSMESILLVAPMTIISPLLSSPSIKASRVDTIELWIWSCLLDLTGARPSISSKKMMEGRI